MTLAVDWQSGVVPSRLPRMTPRSPRMTPRRTFSVFESLSQDLLGAPWLGPSTYMCVVSSFCLFRVMYYYRFRGPVLRWPLNNPMVFSFAPALFSSTLPFRRPGLAQASEDRVDLGHAVNVFVCDSLDPSGSTFRFRVASPTSTIMISAPTTRRQSSVDDNAARARSFVSVVSRVGRAVPAPCPEEEKPAKAAEKPVKKTLQDVFEKADYGCVLRAAYLVTYM